MPGPDFECRLASIRDGLTGRVRRQSVASKLGHPRHPPPSPLSGGYFLWDSQGGGCALIDNKHDATQPSPAQPSPAVPSAPRSDVLTFEPPGQVGRT